MVHVPAVEGVQVILAVVIPDAAMDGTATSPSLFSGAIESLKNSIVALSTDVEPLLYAVAVKSTGVFTICGSCETSTFDTPTLTTSPVQTGAVTATSVSA